MSEREISSGASSGERAGGDASAGAKAGGVTRREVLTGAVAGLAACALGLGVADKRLLPAMGKADSSRLYDYIYKSGVKSQCIDFMVQNMSDTGYLTFGSSEFFISQKLVPTCPQTVFGESCCGVDMTYIGEAFDQCLWQAIAAGAYGDKVDRDKCAIVVSPQWFFRNNGNQAAFPSVFSYELYRAFCRNPQIQQTTRDYVRLRVKALGISDSVIEAANDDTPLDTINDLVMHEKELTKLRTKIEDMVSIAPKKSLTRQVGTPTGEPDWTALLQQADSDGAAACTNNSYGIYDDYWNRNSKYNSEYKQVFSRSEPEYEDFTYFLEVCREVGMQPLVIILPVHGTWYDKEEVSSDERQTYYARIRKISDNAGATYADFSSCEYEKYFLCDTVHPGWRGWVRIEQAFYHFINGVDDDFLGGWNYGSTTGTGLTTLLDDTSSSADSSSTTNSGSTAATTA